MVNSHSKSDYQNSVFEYFLPNYANTYGNFNDFQDLSFQFPWLQKIQENLSGRPARYRQAIGEKLFSFLLMLMNLMYQIQRYKHYREFQ